MGRIDDFIAQRSGTRLTVQPLLTGLGRNRPVGPREDHARGTHSMEQPAATLVLAIAVMACGVGEPVQLLTGVPPQLGGDLAGSDGTPGCFTFGVAGTLVTDPQWGTAVVTDPGGLPSSRTVVAWPPGYTGQRHGSEVEVHDRHGNLVAVTGHHYSNLPGGYTSIGDVGAFWSCDTPS